MGGLAGGFRVGSNYCHWCCGVFFVWSRALGWLSIGTVYSMFQSFGTKEGSLPWEILVQPEEVSGGCLLGLI